MAVAGVAAEFEVYIVVIFDVEACATADVDVDVAADVYADVVFRCSCRCIC